MATVPDLRDRIAELLRTGGAAICLDLSELAFIDSSGIHLLLRSVQQARRSGRRLQIGATIAPGVMRVLRLTGVSRLILDNEPA